MPCSGRLFSPCTTRLGSWRLCERGMIVHDCQIALPLTHCHAANKPSWSRRCSLGVASAHISAWSMLGPRTNTCDMTRMPADQHAKGKQAWGACRGQHAHDEAGEPGAGAQACVEEDAAEEGAEEAVNDGRREALRLCSQSNNARWATPCNMHELEPPCYQNALHAECAWQRPPGGSANSRRAPALRVLPVATTSEVLGGHRSDMHQSCSGGSRPEGEMQMLLCVPAAAGGCWSRGLPASRRSHPGAP